MRLFRIAPAILLFGLVVGCARVPANRASSVNKILVVTMTVRGQLEVNRLPSGNFYYVLLNLTDNIGDAGPAPVVGPPWGNGFAAPSRDGEQGFVGFVRYSRDEGLGGLGVYTSQVGGELVNPVTLRSFTPIGPPDRSQTPQPGDSTISFQLDLGRLPNADKRFLQINLLATDTLPLPADPPTAEHRWDALGDGTQTGSLINYLTLDTRQNRIITNSQQVSGGPQEIANDVRDRLGPTVDDPTLDIVDWTIQLRDP
ncbi:MAG: hypothetical protein SFU56_01395 [Capsulimonadales bacterium]|nr:hypothetical protein [Capsulimonadales bacterium]